ncbi:MAG TPA: phage major capsid protein [Gammaproteobacteria bacterium]|nr:phage major capsid protein [Gammaproteobacteria bacterium]
MSLSQTARVRGLVGVRADASNPAEILNELQKTFEAFKQERAEEISALKKGQEDVVKSEKVDRINAEVSELQKAIDEVNASMAALKVGPGGVEGESPAKAEYKAAFDKFFRKGVEGNLSELAVQAAMQTDSDPDGGYTVPESMEGGIDRVLGEVSAMRSSAKVMQISTGEHKRLVNVGGTASGWVGEREARTETDTATLKQLAFQVMELYANPAATQTMLDDSRVNIESWIAGEVATEFAEAEGTAFISGSGVNQPRGILSYDTVADASWSWGNLGFTVTAVAADINDATYNGVDALIDLQTSLKPGYRPGAKFMMNRTLESKVRKLKTLGDTAAYLWQPSVQIGSPATLLGHPIVIDDNMSNVGANAFPIAFGNFQRGYLIVDRTGIRVLRDPFTNKPYVHFYTTKRVGGGVQNFEAIKLLKCSA